MPNTEMDGETHDSSKTHCPMDFCLGRVDVESSSKYCLGRVDVESCFQCCLGRDNVQTCHKYPWLPELRERLVSPIIGESLGVTRCRVVRKSSVQAEKKRKTVAKKVGTKKRTLAVKRTNPVLRKGHPQDVAHPATVEEAESDANTELYTVTPLREAENPKSPLTETVTMGRDGEQPFYDEDRQGSDSGGFRRIVGWSRHRPVSREVAYGRRSPQTGTRSGVPAFSFRRSEIGTDDTDDRLFDFLTLNTEAET